MVHRNRLFTVLNSQEIFQFAMLVITRGYIWLIYVLTNQIINKGITFMAKRRWRETQDCHATRAQLHPRSQHPLPSASDSGLPVPCVDENQKGFTMGIWYDLMIYPLVNIQKAIENCHSYWIFPLNMVIFHCYVSSPEGNPLSWW